MNIKLWDKLSGRQRVIAQSVNAYYLALAGVAPWNFLEWEPEGVECQFCNGAGVVEALTGNEPHTWACPDCDQGKINREQLQKQLDCLGAFKAALRGAQ